MQRILLVVLLLMYNLCSSAQCDFNLEIVALNEPFCPTSFDGQLAVEVDGLGDYSYEWKDAVGNNPPGGPQSEETTLPFLMPNQTYWVFVTDNLTNCTDSISYSFEVACDVDTATISVESPFSVNPVSYNTWSTCEVRIDNLGCELSFKPEFRVSHAEAITQGDFQVEYYNTESVWEELLYEINAEGDAIGYWGDEAGETVSCNSYQSRPVRVKFSQNNPEATLGNYTAFLRVWSLDEDGNMLSIVSDTALVNIVLDNSQCEGLSLNVQLTDATCVSDEDGVIDLIANGGLPQYLYSLNGSQFSTSSTFNVGGGSHIVSVMDANNCEITDTVFVGPSPLLPDSIWFSDLYPTSVLLNWQANELIDGYHFRYKPIESSENYTYEGIGAYNNNIPSLDSTKIIDDLLPSTTYQIQCRINSLSDCVEGWTELFYFTTPDYFFDYELTPTCANDNTGAIDVQFVSQDDCSFDWQGPNGFSSVESSVAQLLEGEYTLVILSSGGDVIVDTMISVPVYESSDLSISLNNQSGAVTEWEGEYYVTICYETDQLIASSGFFDYIWNGVASGISLSPWQTQPYYVEAVDSNLCVVVSDTINTTVVSDFIDFYNQNDAEDYIQQSYNYCSLNPPIEVDVSPFVSGAFPVQWVEQVIGESSTIIGDASIIPLSPEEDADYTFVLGSCTYDFHVNVYPSPELDELSVQDVSCFGMSDGFVEVGVVSEVLSAPFTYTYFDTTSAVIFNEQTSTTVSSLSELGVGDYMVVVTDAELCSDDIILTVQEPDSLFVELISLQHVNCFGDETGSVTVSLGMDSLDNLGGVAPYTFALNGENYQTNNSGLATYSGLLSGNYTVTVTDANSCSSSISFQVEEPSDLTLTNLSPEPSSSCFGVSDAYVQLLVEGGTAPYSLYIDDELFVENDSDSVFTHYNLSEGTYSFYAEDTLGCVTEAENVTIIEPNPLQFGVLMQENVGESLFSCSGDSTAFVQLGVISGGTPPFDYQLEYPNGFWTPFTSISTYTDLYAGAYIASVQDAGGCEGSISFQITEPAPLEYVSTVMSHVLCYGEENGVYSYSINGGTPPYQDFNGNNISPTGVETSVSAGTYDIQVFDANQCEVNEQVVITEPAPLELFIDSITHVMCYGTNQGGIYAHVTGGTAPYQYFLNGVLIYNTPSSYIVFSDLYASDYTIEVLDVYGCSVFQSNVQIDFLGNTPLVLSEVEHQNASCYQSNDGAITIEATGGCGNYTYWLDYSVSGTGSEMNQFVNLEEDEYVLTVVDDCGCSDTLVTQITQANYLVLDTALVNSESCFNACDGEIHLAVTGGSGSDYQFSIDQQNYQSSSIFQNLCAGTYQVSVLNNTCDTFMTVEVGSSPPLQFSDIIIQDVSCFEVCDGVLEANVVGGTPPYEYALNGGVLQEGNIFSDLCPDVYAVLVEDVNGCSIDSISLDTELHEPDTLVIDILAVQHLSCYGTNDGAVVVSVDDASGNYGGTAPFTFTIDGGDTQVSMNPNSGNVVFDNLAPGEHFIELIDANGCADTLTIFIIEPEVLGIHVQSQMDTINCYGGMTGFVELNAVGGTPTYTYTIEGENITYSQQSEWFYNLEADEYVVTVEDVSGCQAAVNVFIEEHSEIQIEEDLFQHQDVTCHGAADGSFILNVTGGVGPYTIGLAGDALEEYPHTFNDLIASQYIIEVVDSLQCLQTASVFISEPEPLQFSSFNINDVLCFGESNGNVIVELTGGTPAYQFLLDGDSIEAYIDLPNGNYHLEVLDANACSIDSLISIDQPDPLLATVVSVTDVSCNGYADGEIDVQVSGGTINYQYQVNNSEFQSNNVLSGLSAGENNIVVLDNNDCEYQLSWQINEPEEVIIVDYELSDYQGYCVLCEGDETGWVTVNAQGGTPAYQYYLNGTLNSPATSSLIQGLEGGAAYVLSVQDNNGCWSEEVNLFCNSSTPITISQDQENFISPNCCYTSDGQIEVQAIGGLPPLVFSLNNGSPQEINTFDNLTGGTYCVTVEDVNACQQELCDIVLQSPEMLGNRYN